MTKNQDTLQLLKYTDFLLIKNNEEETSYFKKIKDVSNFLKADNSLELMGQIRAELPDKLKIYKKKNLFKRFRV